MKFATVRVPATTANLGPGFDAMGVALKIYNTVRVAKQTATTGSVDAIGRAAGRAFFTSSGVKPFGFSWAVKECDVPRSRGLGSSVTVRLGILHGLNEMAGRPLDRQKLFELCAGLEGHPDNAAPAAFGGFTIAAPNGAVLRFPVEASVDFVIWIPDFELATSKARKLLPPSVPLKDAAKNVGNAAAVAAAFATRDYRRMTGCFGDQLHQPYRAKLLPELDAIITAGCRAGALGGWLSGSGSAVACLALGRPDRVAMAMHRAGQRLDAVVRIVSADNSGARVLR